MKSKLSFVDVLANCIRLVENKTGKRCYDHIPLNAPLPHYSAEIVGQEPVPSKTMWKESFDVYIHSFAQGPSSMGIFDAIQEVEEAFTIKLPLPDGYQVLMQQPMGLQAPIMNNEDGAKHAVTGYKITILYGYKTKN